MTLPADLPPPIKVGDVAIHPLVEIPRLLMDPDQFFVGAEKRSAPGTAWYNSEPHWDVARDQVVLTIQAFLIRTPTDVLLIDAGVGNHKTRRLDEFRGRTFDWLGHLTLLGLTAADIPTVVFTHLHPDHVGWATQWVDGEWRPTFPTARHVVSRRDYEFWTSEGPRQQAMLATGDYMTDSIRPLVEAGLLDLIDVDDEVRLSDEVQLVAAAGHTPGSLCVAVTSQGQRALLVGDLLHHPLQCHDPDINSGYCVDVLGSAAQRRAVMETLAASGTLVVPAHFPTPGYLQRDGTGFRFTDAAPTGP